MCIPVMAKTLNSKPLKYQGLQTSDVPRFLRIRVKVLLRLYTIVLGFWGLGFKVQVLYMWVLTSRTLSDIVSDVFLRLRSWRWLLICHVGVGVG